MFAEVLTLPNLNCGYVAAMLIFCRLPAGRACSICVCQELARCSSFPEGATIAAGDKPRGTPAAIVGVVCGVSAAHANAFFARVDRRL